MAKIQHVAHQPDELGQSRIHRRTHTEPPLRTISSSLRSGACLRCGPQTPRPYDTYRRYADSELLPEDLRSHPCLPKPARAETPIETVLER
jgi:hypothetical protein